MTTVKNDLAYIAGYLESYLEDGGDIQMQCLFDDVLALIAKPKDNQIIVDELRPMAQVPEVPGDDFSVAVLAYSDGLLVPDFAHATRKGWHFDRPNNYIGWIPMPIYHQRNEHSG